MTMKLDVRVSRRCFLASASGATALAFVAPLKLFAEDDGLVQTARRTAEASTVTVQKLRGNLSVLMGAGGNIAVLTGRDGKLLIDTGFAGARPKITSALASISSDPIKHKRRLLGAASHTSGAHRCLIYLHLSTLWILLPLLAHGAILERESTKGPFLNQ